MLPHLSTALPPVTLILALATLRLGENGHSQISPVSYQNEGRLVNGVRRTWTCALPWHLLDRPCVAAEAQLPGPNSGFIGPVGRVDTPRRPCQTMPGSDQASGCSDRARVWPGSGLQRPRGFVRPFTPRRLPCSFPFSVAWAPSARATRGVAHSVAWAPRAPGDHASAFAINMEHHVFRIPMQ
eukprot:208343-Chlamydomonas_euryale.AAC.2